MSTRLLTSRKPADGNSSQAGFTLIEIILVITLIAAAYAAVAPDFSLNTAAERSSRVGQFAEDFRKAYDMSVLFKRPYRMVVGLGTDIYWLETTEARDFYLGTDKSERDGGKEAYDEEVARLNAEFEEYKDLAGNDVSDPTNDRTIPPASPLLAAKDAMMPTEWFAVTDDSWGEKKLGSELVFQDLWAEHHQQKQTAFIYAEADEAPKAYIYFFPSGYVERAVIHIAVKESDTEIDTSIEPFTLITEPTLGTVTTETGYNDVQINN